MPLHDVEMMEGRLSGSDYSLNATQSSDEDGREWIDALEDDGVQAAEAVEDAHDGARLRDWLVKAHAAAERARALHRGRAQAEGRGPDAGESWAKSWACRKSACASWKRRPLPRCAAAWKASRARCDTSSSEAAVDAASPGLPAAPACGTFGVQHAGCCMTVTKPPDAFDGETTSRGVHRADRRWRSCRRASNSRPTPIMPVGSGEACREPSRRLDRPIQLFAYGVADLEARDRASAPSVRAVARGWHRAFCLRTHRFRGTPDQPGLMMALDRGGQCRGVLYELPPEDPAHAA